MESIQTQITEVKEIKKGRGRPRIHFEIKVKKCKGRPLGSYGTNPVKRTDAEISEHRKIRTKKYFENNPQQVIKAKEAYKRYYEANKIEINEKRMKKKHDLKTET